MLGERQLVARIEEKIRTLFTQIVRHHVIYKPLLNKELLLPLDLLDKVDWDLERLCSNLGRCKCQPLRQGNVGNAIGLVDFDPDEVLSFGSVLNVVTTMCQLYVRHITPQGSLPRVVREHGRVAGRKVKSTGRAAANEHCGLGTARVEVQPLLSLNQYQ